ncbi:MAG: RNA repair domain-containing protein [Desulfurococcales archaeon]|nr:RNA repair domain-containing protein [Desulfurococcales archaeon]
MGRRRSRIKQEINKLLYSGGGNDYTIMYIDRTREAGARLKSLPLNRVKKVTEWAVYLDDEETVIPLHRIVEIRDSEGVVVWRRYRGRDTG